MRRARYAEERPRLHGRPTRSAPAPEAGLQPGDRIASFNGTAVTGWDQLQDLIRDNDDGAADDRLRARRPSS